MDIAAPFLGIRNLQALSPQLKGKDNPEVRMEVELQNSPKDTPETLPASKLRTRKRGKSDVN